MTPPGSEPIRPRLGPITVLVLFVVLAVLQTLPMAFGPSRGAVGVAGDSFQSIWQFWWTHEAVTSGLDPLRAPYLFWPTGASLHIHAINAASALATWPILSTAGPVAAYNAALVGHLAFAAFGAWLLARRLWGDPVNALVAGFAFAFGGFFAAHALGHLVLVSGAFLPLGLLGAIDFLDGGRLRHAALFGIAMAGSVLSLYYALFLALCTSVIVLWGLVARRKDGGALYRWSVRASGLVIAALLFAGPVFVPLAAELGAQRGLDNPRARSVRLSADLLSWVTPGTTHPLIGPAIRPWAHRLSESGATLAETVVCPGLIATLLAGLGLRGVRSGPTNPTAAPPLLWATLAVVAFVLSLGPELKVAGMATGLPLPYLVLETLPGFRALSSPARLAVVALLAVALLAARGLQLLRGRLNPSRRRLALAAAGVLLATESAWAPFPYTIVPAPSPVEAAMAREAGTFAVVDVPFLTWSPLPMIGQMTHHRPILNGYISREPPDCVACRLPWPFSEWSPHFDPAAVDVVSRPNDPGAAHSILHSLGVRFVLLRSTWCTPAAAARLADSLRRLELEGPVASDGEVAAFRVPAPPSADGAVVTVALVEGVNLDPSGWSEVRSDAEGRAFRAIVLPRGARVLVWATRATRAHVRIQARKVGPGRRLRLRLDGTEIFDDRLRPERQVFETEANLRLGSNELVIEGGAAVESIEVSPS